STRQEKWAFAPQQQEMEMLGYGARFVIDVIAKCGSQVKRKQQKATVLCPAPKVELLSHPPYEVDQEIECKLSFKNPLPKALEDATFVIQYSAKHETIQPTTGSIIMPQKSVEAT